MQCEHLAKKKMVKILELEKNGIRRHAFDTLRTGQVENNTRKPKFCRILCQLTSTCAVSSVGVVSAIWNSTLCPNGSNFLSRESMSGMRFGRIWRHSNVGIMGWMSEHGAGHTHCTHAAQRSQLKWRLPFLPSIECSARESNNNDCKRQRKLFRVHCRRRRHRRINRVKSKFYGEKNEERKKCT